MNLSLVVITRNEEDCIERCLASVPFAWEKLVVDSGSTDGTVALAGSLGARVLSHPFESFSRQKNWAASQAAGEWILSLDADESLDPELAAALDALLEGAPELDAYRLRFRVVYHGWPMRFGPWSGESHLRLYRKGAAAYGKAGVHEGLSASCRVGLLRQGFVLHRSWESDIDQEAKMERYARLWAEDHASRHRRVPALQAILRPAWRFLSGYLLMGGFLEGGRGWAASVSCARYVRRKWMRLSGVPAQGPMVTIEPGSTPSSEQTGEDEPGT
jgi:glycosyltransferase involved in cell wall biosynthesis